LIDQIIDITDTIRSLQLDQPHHAIDETRTYATA